MSGEWIVLVPREGFGSVAAEDRAFGIDVFETFLHTLESEPTRPAALLFYTEGVKLLRRGSPVVAALEILRARGVRVLACRTCVEKYGLAGEIDVAEIGTMKDMVSLMGRAAKVVTV